MTTDQEAASPECGAPLEADVAGLAMAIIVLITIANVLVRYFTNASLAWTEEMSVFLMLVLTLAGCAAATSQDRMIRVGFLYERGSVERRRRLAWVSALFSAAMFGALAILLLRQSIDEFRYAETTAAIGVPRWWYTGALVCLTLAVAWRSAGRRRRLPFSELPDEGPSL